MAPSAGRSRRWNPTSACHCSGAAIAASSSPKRASRFCPACARRCMSWKPARRKSPPRRAKARWWCPASPPSCWLIPRLYAFNALHRKIEVRLSASHAPVDFARDGIDIAIRVGRPPWPRNVVAAPFLADRIGPVCAPALLDGRKTLRVAELRRHRLLHAETRAQSWANWARARGAGIDAGASQSFEHHYFMLEAAASGLGIGIASFPLVESDLKSGRLIAPFGFVPSGNSYCVLHARQAANNAKIAAFRSWIVSTAG